MVRVLFRLDDGKPSGVVEDVSDDPARGLLRLGESAREVVLVFRVAVARPFGRLAGFRHPSEDVEFGVFGL